MADVALPEYDIYKGRFNYVRASEEADCGIPEKRCPARIADKQGAPHPLMPLGICAGCRKDPEAYIKKLKIIDRLIKELSMGRCRGPKQ